MYAGEDYWLLAGSGEKEQELSAIIHLAIQPTQVLDVKLFYVGFMSHIFSFFWELFKKKKSIKPFISALMR